MDKDFLSIEYLKCGNDKQQKSYEVLTQIKIFNILSRFNPILVGTIPIQIDIDSSDLDIVCEVNNFKEFEQILINNFEKHKDFKIEFNKNEKILVCNFIVNNIEIEIYSSTIKSIKTNGYRHMIIEHRLLNLGSEEFKSKIINLKKNKIKTEPSFAQILKLQGNPYEELLLLENYSDEELKIKFKTELM